MFEPFFEVSAPFRDPKKRLTHPLLSTVELLEKPTSTTRPMTDPDYQCLNHISSRHSQILLRKSVFFGIVLDLLLAKMLLLASNGRSRRIGERLFLSLTQMTQTVDVDLWQTIYPGACRWRQTRVNLQLFGTEKGISLANEFLMK
jgi:hypothetical protein